MAAEEAEFASAVRHLFFAESTLFELIKLRMEMRDVKKGVIFDDIQIAGVDITPLSIPQKPSYAI